MKKILICSTAIVAAGLIASPASAAEKIKLGLGGYMNTWMGASENDSSYNNAQSGLPNLGGFDVQQDAEIHVGGSTTLDNGLTISVMTEMETASISNSAAETTNTDETYVTVSSASMGSLTLGSQDMPSSEMHNTVPDVGYGLDDGDFGTWISQPSAVTAPVATDTDPGGDAMGIGYMSPSFSGFSIGLGYKPETTTEASGSPRDANDGWSAAIAYSGKFGEVSVNADLGYGVLNDSTAAGTQSAAYDETSVGLSIGFGAFTVGGAYKNIDQDTNGTSSADGNVWTAGVSYATGPMALSVGYLSGENKGTIATAGDDETTVIMASASYDLGGGIGVAASVFKADYDDESTANANNNEGWAAIAGVTVGF